MDIILLFKALILGIIEGLTEFLPISSTGHLIVVGDLLNFKSNGKVFEIAIQLGAVLAVIFEYRQRFTHVITHLGKDKAVNRFVVNLAVAFIPAAVVGLIFSKQIKVFLFNPITVAAALVLGGFIILWVERRQSKTTPKVTNVDDMRMRDALVVGLAQICALVPGTSRSGSTIMGGMLWGLERKVATEFSFFLAVPVMIAATTYDVLKHYKLFTMQDIGLIVVGFVSAFVAGLLAVKALLKFVASKNYVPFAYYRIVFGGLILLTWIMGWVDWTEM
ncbi:MULTISPECIES: undecaprenyl-diphosphate phosphatase [unclassified Neisseria]|uniref:undecaprenyl-diphosphate phosphatase n=1 Tax=unclassified Neisseria TaxID=2623750 RepID=UPI002665753B|nr:MULTISPECIES: undecaprenyl-diphosphate phosphatase [unclassified Neisseria]MDO1510592.1 undecaprenyl-diphosphate phosphatase [Neisseria sp. MVDL19-042950]MDO1516284.1 undecaprenyl-diphosphate phosphatase [Neisseria sp. MVDL18-041461]MDO1564244.1 undecaprenyl-diphosphate phosphatase [Neisseria sp. MVDL20-010259]